MKAVLAACVLATLLVAPAATAQPATQTLRWLALGDSYSSGEGVYGAGNGLAGGDDACARSRFAWARLAATWVEKATDPAMRKVFATFGNYLGPEVGTPATPVDVDMTFLACSGAETTDQQSETEDLDEQLAQATGTYDVITFSFGGNDAEFSDIIKGCLNPVQPYGCDQSEEEMTGRIRDEVAPKLDAAYRKIRKKLAPGGRVVVLGYPRLLDLSPLRATCFGVIPRRDIESLRHVADVLNETIARVARANGLDYVDVATPFEGRNACGTGVEMPGLDLQVWLAKETLPLEFTPLCLGMKWVNGISVGAEVGVRHMHSFHPNLCGHVVESLLVANRVLGWRVMGDALAKPRKVQLYHGGLAVEIGDHETLQYQYGDPVDPVVDHLTQLFGLPGEGDTVPLEPGACGSADGMTWDAVLTVCVRDGRFVGYAQSAAHPAVTTPDGVTAGSEVWRLLLSSGQRLFYIDESRRIGGKVVQAHSYLRCDSTELGDPPQAGRLRSPDDWTGEIVEIWDGPDAVDTCTPTGPEPVPAEQYRQGSFYFFTSANGEYLCGIAEDEALCQGETYPVPPVPTDCRVGWGHGLFVGAAGEVDFLCAGGVVYYPLDRNPDGRDKLPVGRSISGFGFTCSAEGVGIRCVQESSGHGFVIAPAANERF